jgi:hypothetical protein
VPGEAPSSSSSSPPAPAPKRERFEIPDYFYDYAVVPVEGGYQVNPYDENLPHPKLARSVGSVAREIAFRCPVSLVLSMCLSVSASVSECPNACVCPDRRARALLRPTPLSPLRLQPHPLSRTTTRNQTLGLCHPPGTIPRRTKANQHHQ